MKQVITLIIESAKDKKKRKPKINTSTNIDANMLNKLKEIESSSVFKNNTLWLSKSNFINNLILITLSIYVNILMDLERIKKKLFPQKFRSLLTKLTIPY